MQGGSIPHPHVEFGPQLLFPLKFFLHFFFLFKFLVCWERGGEECGGTHGGREDPSSFELAQLAHCSSSGAFLGLNNAPSYEEGTFFIFHSQEGYKDGRDDEWQTKMKDAEALLARQAYMSSSPLYSGGGRR